MSFRGKGVNPFYTLHQSNNFRKQFKTGND